MAKPKLRKVWAGVLLLAAATAQAAPETAASDKAKPVQRVGSVAWDNPWLERVQIAERAQSLFSLLSAEMLQRNREGERAVAMYTDVLRHDKRPEVAKRALTLALENRAYWEAWNIYLDWRRWDKLDNALETHMLWVGDVLYKRHMHVYTHFALRWKRADQAQQRDMAVLMAYYTQYVVGKPDAAVHLAAAAEELAKLDTQAQRSAELRGLIALYAPFAKKEADAWAGLQRLTEMAPNLKAEPARNVVRVLAKTKPQLLKRFLVQQKDGDLPVWWLAMAAEFLAEHGSAQESHAAFERLLQREATVDRYMLAGLAAAKVQPRGELPMQHFNKAYALSSDAAQRSHIALTVAMHLLDLNDMAGVAAWLPKIDAPAERFDYLLLSALTALQSESWQNYDRYMRQLYDLPENQGRMLQKSNIWLLELMRWERQNHPQSTLLALNKLIAEIERQGGEAEILARAYSQRGLVYSDGLGDWQAASDDFRRALKLQPDRTEGMNALGYNLLHLGEQHLPEAVSLLQRAYSREPDSPYIADSLGWAYVKQGLSSKALPLLEYAWQQLEMAEAGAHLGAAYYLLGRRAEAEQVWRRSWELENTSRALQDILQQYGIRFP